MKNTARVRKNAATKAASVQTKTTRTAQTVRIILHDEEGETFADFEVSKCFHAAMKCDAQAKGISMTQWIKNATLAKVEKTKNAGNGGIRHLPSLEVKNAAEELNEAASQACVLLELIENHLDHREHRGGSAFVGERADQFNFGLSLLSIHTSERLKKAAADVMETAYGKKTEVAS